MPGVHRGCSVLTRPSRHSGKPVSSSTWVTGTPGRGDPRGGGPGRDELDAGRVQAAGELLQPGLVVDADQGAADRPLRWCSRDRDLSSVDGPAVAGQAADDVDEQPALDRLDALVQRRLVVAVADLDRAPGR